MEEKWWKDPWIRSIIKFVLQSAVIFGVLALFAKQLDADELYKYVMIALGIGGTNLIQTKEK